MSERYAADTAPLAGLIGRIQDGQNDRFEHIGRQVGWCEHPVRISGWSVSANEHGEVVSRFRSDSEPGGVLLLRCRNRRLHVCEPCSRTYGADTWQLVVAGLRGGKGVPKSVVDHPRIFATLTAPSFGKVHSAAGASRSACSKPVRRSSTCAHGARRQCRETHGPGDARVGTPICPECFDYEGMVVWNAHAPSLWARTAIAIRRELARELSLPNRHVEKCVRLSYVKVAEFQRRGAVHLHVVARLDARDAQGHKIPPEPFRDPQLLARAVASAARRVMVVPPHSEEPIRWGRQADVRVVSATASGDGQLRDTVRSDALAGYLAKYVTKEIGRRGPELRELDLQRVDALLKHYSRIREACLELADKAGFAELNLRNRVETFGYPQRPSSRSRAFSTTMRQLRIDRQKFAVQQLGLERVNRVGQWSFVGQGWSGSDAVLATQRRAEQARISELAREARNDRADN